MVLTSSVIVFYDQSCGLCQQSKRNIEKWDQTGIITWRAIQEPGILTEYPFLKGRNIQEKMHLLEQQTYLYTGFAAVKRLIQMLPAGKWAEPFFHVPGVNWAGDKLYNIVASNRHAFSRKQCDSGSCGIARQ